MTPEFAAAMAASLASIEKAKAVMESELREPVEAGRPKKA